MLTEGATVIGTMLLLATEIKVPCCRYLNSYLLAVDGAVTLKLPDAAPWVYCHEPYVVFGSPT